MSSKGSSQKQGTQDIDQKVDFEEWYAIRKALIPGQHHKEILKADFKGRGLGLCETIRSFDEALNKYGVKLG